MFQSGFSRLQTMFEQGSKGGKKGPPAGERVGSGVKNSQPRGPEHAGRATLGDAARRGPPATGEHIIPEQGVAPRGHGETGGGGGWRGP